ncbi:hypothetical protein FQN57_002810 [Myotisia sp. PD_48]|nr:hypothetical protein FQN57_002810 [Myotisia sp. PD_48]
MDKYALLDQAEEDALHKSRLLTVEEKPFKRITKRLLAPDSLIASPTAFLPTPPPENGAGADAVKAQEAEKQKLVEEWRQMREDITLDFAAFETSITRIHFLLASNEKERERYASQKLEILAKAKEVRDNTADLRAQLKEAQKTLALRKTYDELADKITSNRLLRPRDDQQANLEKLHAEIAKLENESLEYAHTWEERKEQFGRIVEEGMNLRRLIRDEKEEVERREGMEEGADGDEGDAAAAAAVAAVTKGKRSATSTPKPGDHEPSPVPQLNITEESNAEVAARIQRGNGTPLRQVMLASPSPKAKQTPGEDEDENMVDEGEVTADESTDKKVAASDKMDTT